MNAARSSDDSSIKVILLSFSSSRSVLHDRRQPDGYRIAMKLLASLHAVVLFI